MSAWIVAGIIALFLELLLPSFVFLSITISCAIVYLSSYWIESVGGQWLIFIGILICELSFILPLLKHFLIFPPKISNENQ